MLFRYGTRGGGELRKKAHIYTQDEHGIDPSLIDQDAAWVVRRLRGAGHHAYIVGGAVRDLLTGRTPKDFDIATDAHPAQIRRLFRSARLIGRRFRLVHVYITREKFIEVSTFRSRSALGTMEHTEQPDVNNLYGTIEEDAERRDFTMNALYYSPGEQQLVDYVDGLPDIRHRRLRTLGPAEASFNEDPVRMIRLLKYATLLGFPLPGPMAGLVRRLRGSLLSCSKERMTEEVYKILSSGGSAAIFESFHKLKVFDTLFPALAARIAASRARFTDSDLGVRLADLDAGVRDGRPLDRSDMFGFLFRDLVLSRPDVVNGEDPGLLVQQLIRSVAEPLFPSKKDLGRASEMLVGAAPVRHRPPRHRGAGDRERGAGERERGDGQHGAAGAQGTASKRRRRRGGRRRGRRGGGAPRPAN